MRLAIFNRLLAKKMTRKEFLLHMGLLFVTITGISGLLKTLADPYLTRKQTTHRAGFGGGTYGGKQN